MVDSDDESNALVVSLLLPGLAGSTVDDASGLCAVRPLTPESSVLAPFMARLTAFLVGGGRQAEAGYVALTAARLSESS